MKTGFSRRTVLRGAGGVAVALPFLEAMLPRRARAQGLRKYFVPVFTPNGIIPQRWASGTETDFTLGTILQPLEPHRSNVVVIHGLRKQGGPRGDNHQTGIASFLTGRELNTGSFPVGGATSTVGWANGISLDQHLAGEIARTTTTKFKSLELGVQILSGGVWRRMSYSGPDKPITPEISPYAAFGRIFADLNANPLELEKLRAQRKSVLDTVLEQFRYVGGKVTAPDRQKLDAHATSIRDIETRLSVPGKAADAMSCAKPVQGTAIDFRANDSYPAVGKLMMDLLVMALACDLTRVVSLMWSGAVSGTRFGWLGITEGHHDISHKQTKALATDAYDPSTSNESLLKISTWYAQQLAYLIGKLKSVPDPSGTLLDNVVLLWGNEISNGPHDLNNLPYVLAGGGWGARMGRFLSYDRRTPLHNHLLVSALNAMGFVGTTFGNPEWGSGALPRLK